MNEELQKILKALRLGGLRAQWDELLAQARQGRFSHERLLKHVLEIAVDGGMNLWAESKFEYREWRIQDRTDGHAEQKHANA